MASKLARQMAYKKRLEEEHREFQERCKVRKNMFKKTKMCIEKQEQFN